MEDKTASAPAPAPAQEHGCLLCSMALPLLEGCFPEATRDHFRASRVEFLKGLRSLLDARIAHLSKEMEAKGTHVTVE
jgi:hypothetical protein